MINRRQLLAGTSALALASCTGMPGGGGGLDALKMIHTLGSAFVNVLDLLGKLPGPQLPAHTASSPVSCAAAPAANAPPSSLRTCTHSMPSVRRIAWRAYMPPCQ